MTVQSELMNGFSKLLFADGKTAGASDDVGQNFALR